MRTYLGISYVGALSALGVASCCVLPMALMLVGLGGSWIAVFGPIAGASIYVLAACTVFVALSAIVAYRRRSPKRVLGWLAGSAALTGLAWLVLLNEEQINDYLITLM